MVIQIGAGDHMPLLSNPNASLPDSYPRSFVSKSLRSTDRNTPRAQLTEMPRARPLTSG
jgi:hypothetical protein